MKTATSWSSPGPRGSITAELTDPDGGVTDADVMWVWSRAQIDPPADSGLNARSPIAGATSATYTPTNDDTSYFLHVMATYMDAKNDATTDTTPRMAVATAAHAVLKVEDQKQAPAFPEQHADGVEREIAENSPSTTYVGEAIVGAVDPDGTILTYSLDGDDAAPFELAENTREIQIVVVGHPTDLDKEEKNSYTFELKASDGALDVTIMVTITVTGRNEAPSTPVAAKDAPAPDPDANNAPEFAAATTTREVAENTATGTDIGAPVMATDADNDTLTYTLGGADMASFTINMDTGQIMTAAALDFEMPADADTDNAYEVTVTASDGTAEAMVAVTITVIDVDESDEPVIAGDTDGNGMNSKAGVITAFRAYVNGRYTKAQIIAIFRQYVADAASSQ